MGNPLKYIRILLIFLGVSFPSNIGSLVASEPGAGEDLKILNNSPLSPTAENFSANPIPNGPSSLNQAISAPSLPSSTNSSLGGMIQATLPFVMKHLGMIECGGAAEASDFLRQILGEGINFNRSDYLCGPTCRGKCVERPQDVGIPPSIYPFGCSCQQQGCDMNGPIIAPLIKPTFKIVCKQDPRCTCVGMGPGQFTGYSCNWVNSQTLLPVTFKEVAVTPSTVLPGSNGRPPVNLAQGRPHHPPQNHPFTVQNFFPIKWCSCCPRLPIMRSGESED